MFCPNCGKPISENARFCENCGAPLNAQSAPPENGFDYHSEKRTDDNNIGYGFLGFFVPVAGIILYFLWKDSQPRNARNCGIGALVSLCSGVFMSIIAIVIAILIPALTFGAMI
jgi:uncharacterized membrane protein YvbJ